MRISLLLLALIVAGCDALAAIEATACANNPRPECAEYR